MVAQMTATTMVTVSLPRLAGNVAVEMTGKERPVISPWKPTARTTLTMMEVNSTWNRRLYKTLILVQMCGIRLCRSKLGQSELCMNCLPFNYLFIKDFKIELVDQGKHSLQVGGTKG